MITDAMPLEARLRCSKQYEEQNQINRLRSEKAKQETKILKAKYKKKDTKPNTVSIYQIETIIKGLENYIKRKTEFIQTITT